MMLHEAMDAAVRERLIPKNPTEGTIDDYNHLRPHEALDYATPDAVYYASFRVA